MNSDSENDEICTPSDILKEVRLTSISSLPDKSRKKYETVYRAFTDWKNHNNVETFSENILLIYFGELSKKYKSSSLWAHYSMLKSTLNFNDNINIESYTKLRAFLKRKSVGYRAKTAKTFTPDEIKKFINQAPDSIYLATKVALIMGIMGSCRANELHLMNVKQLQDLGSALLVTVPNSNTKTVRKFAITGRFYQICKKYINLRPISVATTSFFINYQNGKCSGVNIGINKFGAMGKQIAKFLSLPNPEMYTGHCFRRSSASLLVDADGDLTAINRLGRWKTTSVAGEYVDDSTRNSLDTPDKIFQSVTQSIITYAPDTSSTNGDINFLINSPPMAENIGSFSEITRNEELSKEKFHKEVNSRRISMCNQPTRISYDNERNGSHKNNGSSEKHRVDAFELQEKPPNDENHINNFLPPIDSNIKEESQQDELYQEDDSENNSISNLSTHMPHDSEGSEIYECTEMHKRRRTEIEDENECDAFGRYVALSLKKLPLNKSILAQSEIQSTLTRYRLSRCNENT